jgi:anti-sigma factor RsiW
LGRPLDRHLENAELNALVPSGDDTAPQGGREPGGLSGYALLEAERHVASCPDCSHKVSQYRQLVQQLSHAVVLRAAPRTTACPKDNDVDWHEVAAGLWPELRATQLIMHAALCDHCGPLLRAATSAITSNDEPTPQEAKLLADLKTPSRPELIPLPAQSAPRRWPVVRWLAPALALFVVAGVVTTRSRPSPTLVSSAAFAEFAVRTHQQHAQGFLPLDVSSESQQTVNEWFQQKLPFSLALPASLALPGVQASTDQASKGLDAAPPNRLEGARLVEIGGKTAAFIAYKMQTGSATLPVSLMVTPNSVAVATGGVEISFKKVSFHYGMVQGYRVVTWSLHGLTYALVSQESGNTQRSCMVCHSAMKDRDLSQTPPPLLAQGQPASPIPQ